MLPKFSGRAVHTPKPASALLLAGLLAHATERYNSNGDANGRRNLWLHGCHGWGMDSQFFGSVTTPTQLHSWRLPPLVGYRLLWLICALWNLGQPMAPHCSSCGLISMWLGAAHLWIVMTPLTILGDWMIASISLRAYASELILVYKCN